MADGKVRYEISGTGDVGSDTLYWNAMRHDGDSAHCISTCGGLEALEQIAREFKEGNPKVEQKAKEAGRLKYYATPVYPYLGSWHVQDGYGFFGQTVATFQGPTAEADARKYANEKNAAEKPMGPRYEAGDGLMGLFGSPAWHVADTSFDLGTHRRYIAIFSGDDAEQRARDYADFLNSQP